MSSNPRQTCTENMTFLFKCFRFIDLLSLKSSWRLALYYCSIPSNSLSSFPHTQLCSSIHSLLVISSLPISVSQSGNVACVLVEDWETVSSYSHSVGVRKVFPDLNGTRLVFIDDKNSGFLLSPANVSTSQLLDTPMHA